MMQVEQVRSPGVYREASANAGSSRRPQLFGAFLVVLSAAAIAIVPTLARLAYDGGSDTLTVITSRSIVSAGACFLVMVALGRPFVIRGNALRISLALGVLYAVHLYGLLGAVSYLPVNVVILVFYLHPLMVGIIAILFGGERMSWGRFAALAAAIMGLGLAVGFSLGNLNWIGMALALTSAVLAAVVIIGGSHAMKSSDSLGVTCYMMVSAAASLVVICVIHGDLRLPVTLQGWTGFGGVAIAYTIGTVAFFAAIPLLGAVRAAMISNLEPVLGILFAMAVLGESVSPLQAIGIVLVIGSIFAMEAVRR
ncbi:MAG TPA: DMT family transporter [Dongiaceae bacterium]|nr:DMT family transporter [Dongiaceae bacterium]